MIAAPSNAGGGMPALRRHGTATELVVDDQPLLILGGELGNSTASSLESLRAIWPKLAALNLNTVLVPASWELIEPIEGTFDFSSLSGALDQARRAHLHVVFLWFGSWKNGMSSYVPAWVKRDLRRFPRAETAGGHAVEALSAFGAEGQAADARAFAALMRFVRQVDGARHTVVMVQVENEVAMIDEAADRSATARAAFAAPVPRALIDALVGGKATLSEGLAHAWQARGARESGSWAEVFGAGAATDEIFMAWHLGRYVDAVARAGKAVYPLPMFVNAALNRPGARPGQYPSGGPLPHLYEVWRAAAPTIDFLSPDIYLPNFADWVTPYARAGNPLFVPEARNESDSGVNALFAIGAGQALGFSPFAIESIADPATSSLAASYRMLGQLAPLIREHRGRGTMTAVLLDKDTPQREVVLGGYRVRLRHDYTWEWSSPARLGSTWPRAGAVIINTGPREYTVAGNGVILTFSPEPTGAGIDPSAAVSGIERIEEGRYENGQWQPGRRLNGDESHQGRHLRLPQGSFGIQRIWLYDAQ